jgi:hypothetical protein
MAVKLDSQTNIEVRSVIHSVHRKGNTPMQIHQLFIVVYREHILSKTEVSVWCTAFQSGRDGLNNEAHSGRPCVTLTHLFERPDS